MPLSPPAGGALNPAHNQSELRGVVSSEGLTGGSPTPQYLEWSMWETVEKRIQLSYAHVPTHRKSEIVSVCTPKLLALG